MRLKRRKINFVSANTTVGSSIPVTSLYFTAAIRQALPTSLGPPHNARYTSFADGAWCKLEAVESHKGRGFRIHQLAGYCIVSYLEDI